MITQLGRPMESRYGNSLTSAGEPKSSGWMVADRAAYWAARRNPMSHQAHPKGLSKISNTTAQALRNLRQTPCPEDEENDEQDQDQFGSVTDAHFMSLLCCVMGNRLLLLAVTSDFLPMRSSGYQDRLVGEPDESVADAP